MIPKAPEIEQKRQDRSVHRAAKRGRRAMMTRVRSPIWTHPSGLMNAARRPPQITLDRQEKLGDFEIKGSALGECQSIRSPSSTQRQVRSANCQEKPKMRRYPILISSIALICLQGEPVGAQSAETTELSCFEGPEFFEDSWFNWRFINNCPFEVKVRYEEGGAVHPFFVGACKTRTLQKARNDVRWLEATATPKAGRCVDDLALGKV